MKKACYLLLLLLPCFFASCFYPRVKLLKEEKKAVVYKGKTRVVFENNNGIKDTVLIYTGYPNGYRSSFDYWTNEKLYGNERPEKRMYAKQLQGAPNYGANKRRPMSINLSLNVLYKKDLKDEGIMLVTDLFQESYCLNKYTGHDTLVFEKRVSDRFNPEYSGPYITKVKYTKANGIVYVEKADGEKWRFIKRL